MTCGMPSDVARCASVFRSGAGSDVMSSVPSFRFGVTNAGDRERDVALRTLHGDIVALAFAEQRTRDGRFHADPRLVDIGLVGADDAVRDGFAVLVFERDPR